jgi:hypothetical protein
MGPFPCVLSGSRRLGPISVASSASQEFFPMPIRKHLTDKTAFGPAAIEAMSRAFEEACTTLQVYAGDEKGREIIATRIIDLARGGLIDPTARAVSVQSSERCSPMKHLRVPPKRRE